MSRKRHLRVCASKRKFYTETEAIAAANSLRKQRVRVRIYPCRGKKGEQRHWHLTTKG